MLRDQLIAAQQHLQQRDVQGQVPQGQPSHMAASSVAARDQSNIDPAIAGGVMMSSPAENPPVPVTPGQESPKTYGRRPLSTSKRAEQNRVAQVRFFFFWNFLLFSPLTPCRELFGIVRRRISASWNSKSRTTKFFSSAPWRFKLKTFSFESTCSICSRG